jgi:hypothetical protein
VEITGLPMRGLVTNVFNPFIIFTILFDFYKVKGNCYMFGGNLVSFVRDFYSGLMLVKTKLVRKGNRKVSVSKKFIMNLAFVPRMEMFSFGLDCSFGWATVDRIRRILAVATHSNENYQVPGPGAVLDELSRVLGLGLGKVVSKSASSVLNLVNRLDFYKEIYKIDDVNDFRFTPIFIGIKNHIDRLLATASEWDASDSIPLTEVADNLCQLDIDHIFSKERNKILSLVKVGEITMKGLVALGKEDDIYYGSSTTESTYTANSSLHFAVKSTMAVALNDLDCISIGSYTSLDARGVALGASLDAWTAYAAMFDPPKSS